MSQAALVINITEEEHQVALGLAGQHVIPGKKPKEKFALLVIYPTVEIQDVGENRRVNHLLKAVPIARDIAGLTSDATAHSMGQRGGRAKWGVIMCAAQPDLPKELLEAMDNEIEFLNANPPDVKYRRDPITKATVAVNIEDDATKKEKIRLSYAVRDLRKEFEMECAELVTNEELQEAKKALQQEDQRLVAEGDRMWARPEEHKNINELHRKACIRLGQERPWCYIALQLIDCPGCGGKVKENILLCPHCQGWLDKGIEALAKMPGTQRKIAMYPDQAEEPVGKGK